MPQVLVSDSIPTEGVLGNDILTDDQTIESEPAFISDSPGPDIPS
jgi:hypothetical protein